MFSQRGGLAKELSDDMENRWWGVCDEECLGGGMSNLEEFWGWFMGWVRRIKKAMVLFDWPVGDYQKID